MKQATHHLTLEPRGRGLFEVTDQIAAWLAGQSVNEGLLTLFIRHSSASILIQENGDADVRRDIETFFDNLVPEGAGLYRHKMEGPDDMPAHIKGALTQTQLAIPVGGGRMSLGTWQGVYLFEHRTQAQRRELILHLIGE